MQMLRRFTSLLPVLAMLFMLAGVAGARMNAEALASPERFALCMGGQQNQGEPHDGAAHDCGACCVSPLVSAPALARLPTQGQRIIGVLAPSAMEFGLGLRVLGHPPATGPPLPA